MSSLQVSCKDWEPCFTLRRLCLWDFCLQGSLVDLKAVEQLSTTSFQLSLQSLGYLSALHPLKKLQNAQNLVHPSSAAYHFSD